MIMRIINALILFATIFLCFSFAWPSKLESKVKATITKTFDIANYDLKKVTVEEKINNVTDRKINGYLYAIHSDNTINGYVYVGEAPSMKNVFDYAILFSPEFKIINTKVLIYREKHGRQIGMKRWLKQFFGMTPSDSPTLGGQVDGISGATISATSMTDSVREVLSSIKYLKNHNKI